ncbi:MAG: crossover junction endodeoxyribonuclease RuvC [Deltaproteobacteria bacterium HGW-Deltaproteobacteria-19]|jgi:crossover junction endodeoxyribonuclease RuvC|nr:MAG: crossover junction endodeoxyribonuclease RuvC [Deltaproteobacteria bacterium HGW-Deltaproteobacteria-19]
MRPDNPFRILGIDPGSHVTGYGVVEKRRNDLACMTYGEIRPPRGASLTIALSTVYKGIEELIRESAPDVMAIEDIFFGKNVRSLIRQGQLRGVAIFAGTHGGLPVFEYTPLEIKKAVVGYGRAEKTQVQSMVRAILRLPGEAPADASDALAVAICHAHFGKDKTV